MSKENLKFNNNFFVSKDVISTIKAKIKEDKPITKEESDTLNAAKLRTKFCVSDNIHYFVIDNYMFPENAHCHWCGLKVADYK